MAVALAPRADFDEAGDGRTRAGFGRELCGLGVNGSRLAEGEPRGTRSGQRGLPGEARVGPAFWRCGVQPADLFFADWSLRTQYSHTPTLFWLTTETAVALVRESTIRSGHLSEKVVSSPAVDASHANATRAAWVSEAEAARRAPPPSDSAVSAGSSGRRERQTQTVQWGGATWRL